MTSRIARCNDIGAFFKATAENERLQTIRIYPESGRVMFVVETRGPRTVDELTECLQYFTPGEAMALAKGLERSAISALQETD